MNYRIWAGGGDFAATPTTTVTWVVPSQTLAG
jgi:hypothetical protein